VRDTRHDDIPVLAAWLFWQILAEDDERPGERKTTDGGTAEPRTPPPSPGSPKR